MKTIFVKAGFKGKVALEPSILRFLPHKVGLISSVQFIHLLPMLGKKLKNSIIGGQILGCNVKNALKVEKKVNAFLYIGDGSFHPLAVALKTKKPVLAYNPFTKTLKKIAAADIENYKKRKKSALVKFLHAENVGILVTTKPGQYYDPNKLESFKKKYKNKKFYTFIADTINYRELENFPFIQAWVNTACPRIEEDIKVINIEEIK
jgi:2-(3-amino-3-carboxypropyl)histidine synthase